MENQRAPSGASCSAQGATREKERTNSMLSYISNIISVLILLNNLDYLFGPSSYLEVSAIIENQSNEEKDR